MKKKFIERRRKRIRERDRRGERGRRERRERDEWVDLLNRIDIIIIIIMICMIIPTLTLTRNEAFCCFLICIEGRRRRRRSA